MHLMASDRPASTPRPLPRRVGAAARAAVARGAAAGLRDRAPAWTTAAGTRRPGPRSRCRTGSPPPSQQAQDRLRRLPGDAGTWAALGSAYVEQARVSGNPAYYAQAQGALDRSTQLQPTGNAAAAVGLGALANARHDFAAARGHAEQALALNPASVEANGVLADAATQLGDTATATAAVQRMLELRPGVAAFTRASYELELHGRVDEARVALERALGGRDQPRRAGLLPLLPRRAGLGRRRSWSEAARPVRARARRRPGRPDVAARPGQGARRRRPGRRGDHRLRPADRSGCRCRSTCSSTASCWSRPAGCPTAPVPVPAARPSSSGSTPRRARPTTSTAALLAADHGDPAEAVRLAEAEWSAPAEHLLRRGAGLGAARGRPGRRGAAADRAGRRAGPAGRDGRLPPRDDPGRAGSRSHRRGDRRAGRGPGHQPALLPAARGHRPADPGRAAGCSREPLVAAAGRAARALRRPCWRSGRPAARPRIRWATSR